MAKSPLPRLLDQPGVAELEFKALMKPALAEPENRAEFPEVDACSKALFDLTLDEAEAITMPAGLNRIQRMTPRDQVAAFEAAGWDVTDDKRRPLRVLALFNQPLWLALNGVAGRAPHLLDDDHPGDWASSLAADAAKFRRR